MPHQKQPNHLKRDWYLNVNARRETHMTMVPTVKAMATERRMPVTISNALSVLMKSHTDCVM